MKWDDIAHEEGTDKARWLRTGADAHGYADVYEMWLSGVDVNALLELGVDQGASLRMWSRCFPQANIIGVDLYERERETGRGVVCVGDASDQRFVDMVAREHGPFDVIVDDASHDPLQVLSSFHALFGHVRPGGFYCIEDLYWPEALKMLPELASQRIARVILEPDAVSRQRNILGPLLILVEAQ